MSYGFSSLAGPPSSDPLVLRLKCRFGIELTIGPVNDRSWPEAAVRCAAAIPQQFGVERNMPGACSKRRD
jgi:hypothetical protein